MKFSASYVLYVAIFIISCNTQTSKQMNNSWPEGIKPPIAEIQPYIRTLHNDTVTDNYYWLNDYFKKRN